MSSILIVEDDRSTRHFLAETLKTAGFSVASANDGVEALKRLRAGSYDLMLLDVDAEDERTGRAGRAAPGRGAPGSS